MTQCTMLMSVAPQCQLKPDTAVQRKDWHGVVLLTRPSSRCLLIFLACQAHL